MALRAIYILLRSQFFLVHPVVVCNYTWAHGGDGLRHWLPPQPLQNPSLVLSISNMLVVTVTSGLRPQLQFQGFWCRSRPLRLARGRRAGPGTEASRLWSRDNHSSLARPGCRSGQEMRQGSTKCGTITNVLCMSWSKASKGHLNVLFCDRFCNSQPTP